MPRPRIAVISFPGTNGDTENLRALQRCGIEAFVFLWNEDREKLQDIDGYFFGAGFSYEDRGRSGMIAARDPLMQFMVEEAACGKAVIGNCNGAQILVESGLIPLDSGLRMSLARNAIRTENSWSSPGFLNEWVWITPTCKRDRCATADWSGAMHIPIAHGEGRFTTKDRDVIGELRRNDQLAFSYCDASRTISTDPIVTPNGSEYAIAGICNPAGNVVALMPHPERTPNGDPYVHSLRRWIETHPWSRKAPAKVPSSYGEISIPIRERSGTEIFIDTIIVNNEERTVEQALRRLVPSVKLKQLRYARLRDREVRDVLTHVSFFNPHKEVAYVRRGTSVTRWNSEAKSEESSDDFFAKSIAFLRRDESEMPSALLGEGGQTGICYVCSGTNEDEFRRSELQEIFANPHASILERFA
ncbi:phosphoribosylformylglycinamidine synthase subunit PurQ [Candidatus Peregrinibacteria bacterium]|nr:phosphoribosylformylglycinamidine synthase subunit PurQ [Candidatus Peregrinibacteria bacterium]MBI3816984.1 phosphoribosylformylglycinamidine synthase subunit PurQ [Candidatus Peregrinibacteria bacterium]